jgi:hypothetical protein
LSDIEGGGPPQNWGGQAAIAIGGALVHMQDGARNDPYPDLLCGDAHATDGVRASGRQHLVQNHHADGCLGLLRGGATCP